jgi:hypothetical protein
MHRSLLRRIRGASCTLAATLALFGGLAITAPAVSAHTVAISSVAHKACKDIPCI